MGWIHTYDLSSRITSSDPGISSSRTVSEEMGSSFLSVHEAFHVP